MTSDDPDYVNKVGVLLKIDREIDKYFQILQWFELLNLLFEIAVNIAYRIWHCFWHFERMYVLYFVERYILFLVLGIISFACCAWFWVCMETVDCDVRLTHWIRSTSITPSPFIVLNPNLHYLPAVFLCWQTDTPQKMKKLKSLYITVFFLFFVFFAIIRRSDPL